MSPLTNPGRFRIDVIDVELPHLKHQVQWVVADKASARLTGGQSLPQLCPIFYG